MISARPGGYEGRKGKMLPYQTRLDLGEIKETEYMYGGYRMEITWYTNEDRAQVTVYDLGERIPLMWSKTMTKAQARGAHKLFEAVGYYEMPA